MEEGAMGMNSKGKRSRTLFNGRELEYIKERRGELILSGLTDLQISKKIGEETGRRPGSIFSKMHNLRKDGKLPANPNNHPRRDFSDQEEALLIQRYKELMLVGLNDVGISKELEAETGRPADSIEAKFKKLRRKSKLPANPNNQKPDLFTPQREAAFVQRYKELLQAGLKDFQISKKMAEEFGRPVASIYTKWKCLRKEGKIPENPNRRENRRFSPHEEASLVKRYEELTGAGLKDSQISKKLEEETGRSAGSIWSKIKHFRKGGKLLENPNNQERKDFTPEEEVLFIQRCKEFIQSGLNDKQLSKKLGEEFGRAACSVVDKVRNLRKKGKIPENPNRGNSSMQMSEDERSAAVQGVLDELDKFGGSQ